MLKLIDKNSSQWVRWCVAVLVFTFGGAPPEESQIGIAYSQPDLIAAFTNCMMLPEIPAAALNRLYADLARAMFFSVQTFSFSQQRSPC